jgi:carboxypeptidase T
MHKYYFTTITVRSNVLVLILSVVLYFSLTGFNFFPVISAPVDNGPKVSQVRIFAQTDADFLKIEQAGLYFDGGQSKPGQYFETWLDENEMKMLDRSGVPYQVIIDDVDAYQKTEPKMSEIEIQKAMEQSKELYNVTHSIYGTMRNLGYLKYAELVNKLDSMRIEYPNLVSVKWSIGNTIESRQMWVVRITKNPDAPTGRPEVLLHAVIHAREPMGMEQQLYFVYWLLENYNVDPIATYILNNREIYWMPFFNPDGYVYNETYSGGNWRCNRHITTGNCGPVDLNRNFGIYQFWNSSNGGSSTNQCDGGSGTYRGTLPFSEIESQNVLNFFNSRNFQAGLGAHTYGNDMLKPWAWCDPIPTPDDAKFNTFLADMTMYNHYITGTPYQALGYYVRGGTDDWYYQDSINPSHHVFIMTPETGTSFWPLQSEILPDCQGMLWPDQYICLVAGPYVNVTSTAFNQPTYQPGQSGTFKVKFMNKGLMTANNVKVNWNPANAYITIPTQQYTYPSLLSFTGDSASFNFTVAGNAPLNCAIPTTVSVKIDTSTIYFQNVYVYVGSGTITLADSAENGMTKWTDPTNHWTVHTDYYHTPTHSFAYAPYQASANYSLTLAQSINVVSYPVTYLTFWNRFDLENGWDFGHVEVSSNNGSVWQEVTSYTGTNTTWTQQSFDITSYANYATQLLIRFRLSSDNNTQNTGWWVDDIKLTNYCLATLGVSGNNNQIPKSFALLQNYPNPFNPSTSIKFQLPKSEFVTITIFDMLGRKVASLVNEQKEAGYYDIKFDGTNYASGMYFYKMEAGNFTDTKKMILIK